MARLSAFLACMLVITSWTCSTTGKTLPIEDKVSQLLRNYEALNGKLNSITEESTRTINTLTAKVKELEAIALRSETSNPELVSAGINAGANRRRPTISGMPASCLDLENMGHFINGFYTIKGDDNLRTVFCDFTKLANETGFQKLIGYNEVKTAPIFFTVRKSRPQDFNMEIKAIPYEMEQTNFGNYFDKTTGVFTAPQAGKYVFIASARIEVTAERQPNKSNGYSFFYLCKNDAREENRLAGSFCDEFEKGANCNHNVHTTVYLKAGDKVYTGINGVNSRIYDDNQSHFASFSGWLIEEDMSLKLASV